jgi:hypothetical protein
VVSKHKPKDRASIGEGTIIGVDLAKNVFQGVVRGNGLEATSARGWTSE